MNRIRSLAVTAMLLGAGTAAAQERCEGTLCDLYYGGSAPAQPAKPAAPTPLTVPNMPSVSGAGTYISNLFSRSGNAPAATAAAAPQGSAAAPQSDGFFHMGGGGVTGQKPSGECSGTLCDLFHGHSSEDDGTASMSQSVNGVPQSRYGNETASAEAVAATAPAAMAPAGAAAEAQMPAQRRVAVRAEPKPPACATKAADPWACYRR